MCDFASREQQLRDLLKKMLTEGVCLAFSGGCDSTLLLALLSEMSVGKNFLPVMAAGPLQTPEEVARAKRLAEKFHSSLLVLSPDVLTLDGVRMNRRDRCYHCKKYFFEMIRTAARERGLKYVIDGTNADDLLTYRPGRKALAELDVASPLAMAGLTKAQVRAMTARYDEEIAYLPATPCLATRFPYDTPLEPDSLKMTADGERALRDILGERFSFRVRCLGKNARLELENTHLSAELLQRLEDALKKAGFAAVSIDPEPFRSGSFDRQEKLS